MGPFASVISHAEMSKLCPTLTAKTELVLVANPTTGDEAMYQRSGKDWYMLDPDGHADPDASAAPDSMSGAAPLSGEVGPDRGPGRRDDDSAGNAGPTRSVPETEGGQK